MSRHLLQPLLLLVLALVAQTVSFSSLSTKFSGTHGDRGMFIFPVQLTTSRIGNLTRLIHTLLYVMTIHTYLRGPFCAALARAFFAEQCWWVIIV